MRYLLLQEPTGLHFVALPESHMDLLDRSCTAEDGLDYVSRLEQRFASLQESEYPLISLLTEIRALQAQLEFLAEE